MNFHDIVRQFSSIQTCTCVQVRRVAAQGGELIESDTAQHTLAPDTVWVTAENPDLTPPDVEDSRTFGPLALDSVVGRCIYAIRSKTDRDHLVNNKARSLVPLAWCRLCVMTWRIAPTSHPLASAARCICTVAATLYVVCWCPRMACAATCRHHFNVSDAHFRNLVCRRGVGWTVMWWQWSSLTSF